MAQTRKQKVLQEVKRKRQQRTIVSIVIVAVLISIIGIGVWALSRNAGNGGNFPFQCLGQEYTNLHVHPWLRIWINTGTGITNVTIPAAVGILNPGFQTDSNGVQVVSNGSCYEPMHTHDASGIIHIESSSISNQYTLDNFFDIWKVKIDGVLFGEAGRVFLNRKDLENEFHLNSRIFHRLANDFRYSYGTGLRIALSEALVARIDVGFSEEEQGLVYLSFGQTF